MTPSALKQYLQACKKASLRDIALHFDTDIETVKAAMAIWVRKGKVEENSASGCEKGCCQCSPELSTAYSWKE